jgi:hypothetical protein
MGIAGPPCKIPEEAGRRPDVNAAGRARNNATYLLIYNNKNDKAHICNCLGICYKVLVALSGLAVTFSSGVWARKMVQ